MKLTLCAARSLAHTALGHSTFNLHTAGPAMAERGQQPGGDPAQLL